MRRYQKTSKPKALFPHPIHFPDTLPISKHIDEIQQAIRSSQVIIVVGETGSGKTTQLPKACLQLGRGCSGLIVHTQPRRLAAKGVAQRLQQELASPEAVGVKIRFEDKTLPSNYIQVMTDGLLLNAFVQDPLLSWCDTLIIDEAHERSLNIDFLLGLVQQLLSKRPEFRLIVTSATIKHHLFSSFFSGAPVFSVSGRTFPVEIQYLGPDLWGSHHIDPKIGAVVQAVTQIYNQSLSGGAHLDTLVFLPGERQIHDTAHALRKIFQEKFDILPLYARLASAAQSAVFHPGARIRIVLATNLAETSITVPRIGFVIDTGLARVSRYSQRRKVQLLPIEAISQASAAQRAGRCGRIAPGVCYRLYDEQDFATRPQFPEAQIHRTHLAGVILQMKAMNLGDVAQFPFIEAPATKMINDGYQLLDELGAVCDRHLTSLGRQMSRLPVDPRLARMIVGAKDCLYEILIVASGLSVLDVLDIPRESKMLGQQRHGQFQSKQSDFVSKVLLWHRLEWHRQKLTRKAFALFCEKHFISIARYYEWKDTHKQLKSIVSQGFNNGQQIVAKTSWAQYLVKVLQRSDAEQPYIDWQTHFSQADSALFHRSIITAFATQIAVADPESGGYMGCRQRLCYIHPSTMVKGIKKINPKLAATGKKTKPKKAQAGQWIIVGEFLETQKLWARQVAHINLEWVLPHIKHLVRYSYAEPVWSKKMGAVVVNRTTNLLGLTLKQKEQVIFSKIDPLVCRAVFIQTALVEQQLGESRFDSTLIEFMQINQEMVVEGEHLEAKVRTSGLIASDQEVYDFFDAVIPIDILDRRSFFAWWTKARRHSPALLHFSRDWFLKQPASLIDFPSTLVMADHHFQLEYSFDVGERHDGITLLLPENQLYQINAASLEWLVPGLRQEKCEALIRGLPKQDRKKFAPTAQFVAHFLEAGFDATEPLTLCLELFLEKMTGHKPQRLSWPVLSDHLCMKIRLLDAHQNIIAEHTDLEQLRALRQKKIAAVASDVIPTALLSKPARENLPKEKLSHSIEAQAVLVSQLTKLPDLLVDFNDGSTSEKTKSFAYSTLSLPDKQGRLFLTTTPDHVLAEQLLYKGIVHLLYAQTNTLVKKQKRDFLQQADIRRMVAGLYVGPGFEAGIQEPAKLELFWRCFMTAQFEQVFHLQDLPRNAQQGSEFFAQRANLVRCVEQGIQSVLLVAKLYPSIARKIAFLSQGQYDVQAPVIKDLLMQYNAVLSLDWLGEPSSYRIQTWPILVQALDHRLEKLSQRAGRDESEAQKIQTLQGYLDNIRPNLRTKPLGLIRQFAYLQWAIQAVRLALFAQHLKITPKVAFKKFQKELEQFEVAIRKA